MKTLRTAFLSAGLLLCMALTNAAALDVETGLSVAAMVAYADAPTLAVGGAGSFARLGEATAWGRWDIGLEAGLSPIGAQVIVPGRAFASLGRAGPVEFLAGGGLLAGIALFKPWPLFMGGAELALSARWRIAPSVSLVGCIGLRYSDCPAYSAIYPYHAVELPFSVSLAF